MTKKVIRVFHSSDCTPCNDVVDRIKKGRFASDLGEGISVDLVDISTEEGFEQIEKENLDRVPVAKYEGKTCQIHIDEELDAVMLTCNEENQEPAQAPTTDNP